MAIYQKIQKSFWTDSKVDDDFTPEQKFLYLYLLTNPHTNMAGCYEISTKQMSRETGLPIGVIEDNLSELQNRLHVIYYDISTKELLLINWWKYNWGSSPKVRTCVSSDIKLIKNKNFKKYLEKINNGEISSSALLDRVSIQYQNSIDTSCSDSVSDSVSDSAGKYPVKEEFMTLCREQSIADKFAESFFERYSANGWTTDNGEAVKNWRNLLLAAWRKQKKQTEPEKQKEKQRNYTLADAVEYPPGSGKYIGRDELEGIQYG